MKARHVACAAALIAAGGLLPASAVAQGKAGAITIAMPREPADLDACNSTVTGIGLIIKETVVETLTVIDPNDSKVLPRLATSWTGIGDGVWRVKLRPDVKFHDGSALDGEAVAKAIARLQDTKLLCRDRTKIPKVVLTTKVVDPLTVEIKADPAQVLMPIFLSFIAVPSPATSTTELSRAPVGSGPYRFKSWTPAGVEVERFDGYWGTKPQVQKATYVFRGESALRASMVDIGEADIAIDIAPQDATKKDRDVGVFNGETTRIRFVMKPPLDDIRVRKALNLAFDRQALVGTLVSPNVLISTQYFLPKINGYNPDLKPWPFDPAQAARLVKEAKAAGVPVDKEIRLIGRIGFFPNQEEILQTIQQMWALVGFNVKLQMMESAEWLKLVNRPYAADRSAMMIQEMHDNNNGDAAFTMPFRYRSDGQQSETADPKLDALLDEAGASTGEKRTKLFQEANRYIAEELVPAVPMYHMITYMRISPRIEYKPHSLSNLQLELADIKLKAN